MNIQDLHQYSILHFSNSMLTKNLITISSITQQKSDTCLSQFFLWYLERRKWCIKNWNYHISPFLYLSVLFDDRYLLWRVPISISNLQNLLIDNSSESCKNHSFRIFNSRFQKTISDKFYKFGFKNDFIQNQNKVVESRLLILKRFFLWKHQKDETLDFSILRRVFFLVKMNQTSSHDKDVYDNSTYTKSVKDRILTHKSARTHASIYSSIHVDSATNIHFHSSTDIDTPFTSTLIPSLQTTTASTAPTAPTAPATTTTTRRRSPKDSHSSPQLLLARRDRIVWSPLMNLILR